MKVKNLVGNQHIDSWHTTAVDANSRYTTSVDPDRIPLLLNGCQTILGIKSGTRKDAGCVMDKTLQAADHHAEAVIQRDRKTDCRVLEK